MKLKVKDAQFVKELYRASLSGVQIDQAKVSRILEALQKSAPANLLMQLRAYRKLVAAHSRRQTALVESAVSISLEEKKDLETTLRAETTAREFDYHHNPETLGGIRVTVGDTLIDHTLLTKYESLLTNS